MVFTWRKPSRSLAEIPAAVPQAETSRTCRWCKRVLEKTTLECTRRNKTDCNLWDYTSLNYRPDRIELVGIRVD